MNGSTRIIDRPILSIVIPALNEEGNLEYLYNEIYRYLKLYDENWEVIIIDDGSSDKTWYEILSLNKRDCRVKGLRFSRNFGHQPALLAGLNFASGRAIITMDADTQHPPEIIPKLIEEWKKGYKIVNTIRLDNENIKFTKRITSKYFYKFFSSLSGLGIKPGMADFRLMDEQVVNEFLKFGETGIFLRGIVEWMGFPCTDIEFKCRNRLFGKTKYNFKSMFNFASTGITSFSIKPLYLGIKLGIVTLLFALGGIAWELYDYIFSIQIPVWISVIVFMFIFFGLLFITIGIIGEYIGRILIETRKRPRYIISEKLGLRQHLKDKFLQSNSYTGKTAEQIKI